MSVMELGNLLTRSSLTYPEVSSEVCHDSFCQLGNSVSLSWVVCREAFCLHVESSSSCIPVVCLEPVLFLIPLQCLNLFVKWVNKTIKKITETVCDSVNHTRFPKEDNLPDRALRENQVKKGDRLDCGPWNSLRWWWSDVYLRRVGLRLSSFMRFLYCHVWWCPKYRPKHAAHV